MNDIEDIHDREVVERWKSRWYLAGLFIAMAIVIIAVAASV